MQSFAYHVNIGWRERWPGEECVARGVSIASLFEQPARGSFCFRHQAGRLLEKKKKKKNTYGERKIRGWVFTPAMWLAGGHPASWGREGGGWAGTFWPNSADVGAYGSE